MTVKKCLIFEQKVYVYVVTTFSGALRFCYVSVSLLSKIKLKVQKICNVFESKLGQALNQTLNVVSCIYNSSSIYNSST